VNLVAPIVNDASGQFFKDRADYFNSHPDEFKQLVSITQVTIGFL
jgi:hypothetical protein